MSNSVEHLNRFEMIGHLSQEPALRHTEAGGPYVRLSLATTERFTDREGKAREKIEWHHGIARGQVAEDIARAFKKGDALAVSGALHINGYEKAGVKNRVTDLVVDGFHKNPDNGPSKNEARLVGVVREDPKVRELGEGRKLVTLSLATNIPGTNGARGREDWHTVNLWGKTAEAARDIKAGDTLEITGLLRHRAIPGPDGKTGADRKLSAIECQKFEVRERARELAVAPEIRRRGKGVERGV